MLGEAKNKENDSSTDKLSIHYICTIPIPLRMHSKKQTRRKFIKQSVTTTSGLILASQFPLSVLSKPASKSKVIIAHSDKVIDADGLVNPRILQDLIDQSILELSGKKKLNEAWLNYFTTKDIIGCKVNANSYSALSGTPMVNHYPLITESIFNSMQTANIPNSNAVIWERTDKELATMGYSIQKEKGELRVMGTKPEYNSPEDNENQPGFSEVVFPVGKKSTHLSNILENDITALINLPALKSHRLAGVTGALKNHYGSIDNPRDFHDDDCCNPGVAEINNISTIREKHKLVICNALMGLWDGGPRWNRANLWMEGSLILGEDPVAVDTVMLQLIDQKRVKAGLMPVAPMAKHLQLSEEIGLGNSNLTNIDLIKLNI